LIAISEREQVAIVRGKPVFRITNVALVPLSSQSDADHAIVAANEHTQPHNQAGAAGADDSGSESDEDAASVTDSLEEETHASPLLEVKDPLTGQQTPVRRQTSVAEDVMQKRGMYGRFADKWFSKKGWSAESRRVQGLSAEDQLAREGAPKNVESTVSEEHETPNVNEGLPVINAKVEETIKPEEIPKALSGQKDETTIALLPKILRTTKMYFSSGNFFFSYDYDLSHGIAQQEANSSIPLFKQFDPLVSLDSLHGVPHVLMPYPYFHSHRSDNMYSTFGITIS
jgi:hypothetical protein